MASSSTGDQLPQVAYIDSNRRLESGEAPKFLAIDPTHKEVAHHGFDNAPQLVKGEDDETGGYKTAVRDKICGLKPKRFWIVLCLVVILIIGGAVGGGVVGSIAASQKGDSDSDVPDTSPSDPTTTSTSTAPDSTTSSSDSEDFTFRGFEGTRYEGRASDLLRDQGSFGTRVPSGWDSTPLATYGSPAGRRAARRFAGGPPGWAGGASRGASPTPPRRSIASTSAVPTTRARIRLGQDA